jgi:protein-S-isoprenylcysteine O-methyltransferase Ste14
MENMLDSTLLYFLPVYLVLYLGAAFFWRSFLVWKRTGVNPYKLGGGDNAHDFIGAVFRLTAVATVLVVILFAAFPLAYSYLTPIPWLKNSLVQLIGLLLLGLSLIWIIVAQVQMGNAWRIGIDTKVRTNLVQAGLFRLSRNPIFLGMRVNLLGFFLVLPNAITLAIWVLGEVLMQIQVRLEEAYLAQVHGESYRDYCHRTRRWL